MPNTEMDTSLSSSLHPHSYQVPSQTIDTISMNSAQASEYEEAESGISFVHSLILLMLFEMFYFHSRETYLSEFFMPLFSVSLFLVSILICKL